jgi:hypothetical protein
MGETIEMINKHSNAIMVSDVGNTKCLLVVIPIQFF